MFIKRRRFRQILGGALNDTLNDALNGALTRSNLAAGNGREASVFCGAQKAGKLRIRLFFGHLRNPAKKNPKRVAKRARFGFLNKSQNEIYFYYRRSGFIFG